eukprot:499560-Hanusia_phi.AAC.2
MDRTVSPWSGQLCRWLAAGHSSSTGEHHKMVIADNKTKTGPTLMYWVAGTQEMEADRRTPKVPARLSTRA